MSTFALSAITSTLAAEEGGNVLFPATYDIVWSAVVFVVLALFFWKFAIPALRKILDEREAQIEGGIRKAEIAQVEAAAKRDENEKLLAAARTEAAEIREQARVDADQIKVQKKAETQAELDRMTASAKAQIEAERQTAIVSLRAEVGTLALDLASGVVGESLREDSRSTAYVDRFLSELDNDQKAGTHS